MLNGPVSTVCVHIEIRLVMKLLTWKILIMSSHVAKCIVHAHPVNDTVDNRRCSNGCYKPLQIGHSLPQGKRPNEYGKEHL